MQTCFSKQDLFFQSYIVFDMMVVPSHQPITNSISELAEKSATSWQVADWAFLATLALHSTMPHLNVCAELEKTNNSADCTCKDIQ